MEETYEWPSLGVSVRVGEARGNVLFCHAKLGLVNPLLHLTWGPMAIGDLRATGATGVNVDTVLPGIEPKTLNLSGNPTPYPSAMAASPVFIPVVDPNIYISYFDITSHTRFL